MCFALFSHFVHFLCIFPQKSPQNVYFVHISFAFFSLQNFVFFSAIFFSLFKTFFPLDFPQFSLFFAFFCKFLHFPKKFRFFFETYIFLIIPYDSSEFGGFFCMFWVNFCICFFGLPPFFAQIFFQKNDHFGHFCAFSSRPC